MSLEFLEQRSQQRIPRVQQMASLKALSPLKGVQLQWVGNKLFPLLEMSLSGFIIPSTGILSQLRLNSVMDVKLRLEGTSTTLPLQLKVRSLTANWVSLQMQSIDFDSRLKLSQPDRDRLLGLNVQSIPAKNFIALNEYSHWWHGPFDTNFLMSADEQKLVVEYDGLCLLVEQGLMKIYRSNSVYLESGGYFASWTDPKNQKVALGKSWQDRLARVLSDIQRHEDGSGESIQLFTAALKDMQGNHAEF